MMRVIAVGRSRGGLEADLFTRYANRIRPELALTEILDGKGSPAEIKRREGEALLAALPGQAFTIALEAHKDQAIALQSEEVYDRYLHYLTGCARLFHLGQADVNQFTLTKGGTRAN